MKTVAKKSWAILLTFVVAFTMMFAVNLTAFAEDEVTPFEYAGQEVNFIKADGSQFGMFTPQEGTTAEIKDGKVVIHLVPKNTTVYAGFVYGAFDAVSKDEEVQPALDVEANEDGTLDIELALDDCGKAFPVAPIKKAYGASKETGEGTWTTTAQYYLAVPAAEYLQKDEPAEDIEIELALTNNVPMFKPADHILITGKEGSYILHLPMESTAMSKVFDGPAVEARANEEKAIDFTAEETNGFFDIPVKSVDAPFILSFKSANNGRWYNRTLTISLAAKTAVFDTTEIKLEQFENMTVEDAIAVAEDFATVDLVNELIEAIQVQYRDENTDKYCIIAKEYYNALSDSNKEKLDDPGYFGDDTGDASKDDPRNDNNIGDKEILVVSFGTSFNGSRVATIKAVEDKIAAAYPDYSVRRAFTAQIIINHIQSRDGEKIDNVEQALDRAVENGVKELVIQPTHLMHGAEYDELIEALKPYTGEFEKLLISEPLLNDDEDKEVVAVNLVKETLETAELASLKAAKEAGIALVYMGHGTEHPANITYEDMQATFDKLGYDNVFVGTVEGLPESTEVNTVLAKVQAAGYDKVILRPLMVVAGDHANNDMADTDDPESWASVFGEALGAENVVCQINGLGEVPAVQQLYVKHIADAFKEDIPVTPGWKQNEAGHWCYITEAGTPATGWQDINGAWYLFDSNGIMQTGWQVYGNQWFYLYEGGQMATGWIKLGNVWYCLKGNGAMAANEWVGGYWLGANGAWTYTAIGTWRKNNRGWWFGDTFGWYAAGEGQKIDGVVYFFDDSGYWIQ